MLPTNKTKKEEPTDMFGILEGAAGLLVMAGRIEEFLLSQKTTEAVKVPRKELYAVAKINRLNAQIVDELVYALERRDEHIKILESIIRVLRNTDA